MFGFYSPWIPYYEVLILPLRYLMRHSNPSGKPHQSFGEVIRKILKSQNGTLLANTKDNVKKEPVMIRADFSKLFYLKTDGYVVGMGEMLL